MTLVRAGEYTPEGLASANVASGPQGSLKSMSDLYLGAGRSPTSSRWLACRKRLRRRQVCHSCVNIPKKRLGSFLHTPGYQLGLFCPSVHEDSKAAVGRVLVLGARNKVSVLTRCTWSGSSRLLSYCGSISAGKLNVNSNLYAGPLG